MSRYPGFRLVTGRDPVAGQDYDPEKVQQDDYEYFTGTGSYSNDPTEATTCPDCGIDKDGCVCEDEAR